MGRHRTDRLNLRQQRFAAEYVSNGGNGSKAYLNAYNGKVGKDYAPSANRLLQSPLIQAEIKRIIVSDPKQLTEDKVVSAIAAIAYGDSSSNMEKLRALELIAKAKGMLKEHKIIEERPSAESVKSKAQSILEELTQEKLALSTVTN